MTHFEHLTKEIWLINRSANRLLIVSTNLDGFSLANHERFAKFAKLSPRQTFQLYDIKACNHNYSQITAASDWPHLLCTPGVSV